MTAIATAPLTHPPSSPLVMLEGARRSAELADTLAARGQTSAALELAAEALTSTWQLAIRVARERCSERASLRSKLARVGVTPAVLGETARALAAARSAAGSGGATVPARLVFDVLRARARLARAVAVAIGANERRARLAAASAGGAALVLLAVAGVLRASGHIGPPVRVEASAQYSHAAAFAPRNAIDGYRGTEWLLPNSTPGELRIAFARPRRVERILVINSVNDPYRDRATRAYRVDVMSGQEIVVSVEGEFGEIAMNSEPAAIHVGRADVDAVIVHVLSWHGAGGGLAEVRLE